MTQQERGFLLLCSRLGDPRRRVLTTPQLRILTQRIRSASCLDPERNVTREDLVRLGYSREMAARIVFLLSQEDVLDYYLHRGAQAGCVPVTRVSDGYPTLLRSRLGPDSPGCLWCRGDRSLFSMPAISLVGNRDLEPENYRFAQAVGRQAAAQGLVLISGNARGSDRAAQDACLEAGGRVVSVVADLLTDQEPRENLCYISEDSYDSPFSAQRALSRNRVIHAMGMMTFVAQCRRSKGGTWDGTLNNLQNRWSNVICFRDGREGSLALEQLGAFLAEEADLQDMLALSQQELTLFKEASYEGN